MVPVVDGQDRYIAPTLELLLDPAATAPAAARRQLGTWLERGGSDGALTEVARLLVSELVTNSVRHARTAPGEPMQLNASWRAGALRIAVHDGGQDGRVARRGHEEPDHIGGYGLDLVAQLARTWGVERDAGGTTVWLEIAPARMH